MIEDIKKWIEDFVSVHNKSIGHVPSVCETGNAQRENQLCIRGKHTITPRLILC